MNEVEYTLLEIIENPKRLTNITHDKYFGFLLESLEAQDRFEAFMKALEYKAWWAYYGFMIMASDMIPFKDLLDKELAEIPPVKHVRSTLTEKQIFDHLFVQLDRALFQEQRFKDFFVKYMYESLSETDYIFCKTCIKQEYKEQILPRIKQMYLNGRLNSSCLELFSFSYDKRSESPSVSEYLVPIKEYKVVKKIGNLFYFDDEMILEPSILNQINAFIKDISYGKAKVEFPNICYFWIDENFIPFLMITINGTVTFRKAMWVNDKIFTSLIHDNYSTFIVCDYNNTFLGCIGTHNKSLVYEDYKIKSVKKLVLPLLLMNANIETLYFTSTKNQEINALMYKDDTKNFKNGDIVRLIKIYNTYYVLDKVHEESVVQQEKEPVVQPENNEKKENQNG